MGERPGTKEPKEAFGRVVSRPERKLVALGTRPLTDQALESPSGRASTLPTFFISHGPGAVMLSWSSESPYVRNVESLFKSNGVRASDVRAIVCFSSHWVSASHLHDVEIPHIGDGMRHTLARDFTGEVSTLYEANCNSINYSPPYEETVATRVRTLFVRAGFSVGGNDNKYQCLDSGVWMPLSRMREFKNIPVIQVSLPAHRDNDTNLTADKRKYADLCMQVGAVLRPLRSEGILLVGSGNSASRGVEPNHLDTFMDALKTAGTAPPRERRERLARWLDYPHARQIHPGSKPRQLAPLHVMAGAASDEDGLCTGDFRLANSALANFCFGAAAQSAARH